jgi:hypothetical protein
MGSRPRISEERWGEIAAYYESGHTLKECSIRFGVSSQQYISKKLKERGVKIRRQFEPSRPEKIKNLPKHHKKRFGLEDVEESQGGGKSASGPGTPSTRRIIPLSGRGTVESNYEKKI